MKYFFQFATLLQKSSYESALCSYLKYNVHLTGKVLNVINIIHVRRSKLQERKNLNSNVFQIFQQRIHTPKIVFPNPPQLQSHEMFGQKHIPISR